MKYLKQDFLRSNIRCDESLKTLPANIISKRI
jgi:hypothetical protein